MVYGAGSCGWAGGLHHWEARRGRAPALDVAEPWGGTRALGWISGSPGPVHVRVDGLVGGAAGRLLTPLTLHLHSLCRSGWACRSEGFPRPAPKRSLASKETPPWPFPVRAVCAGGSLRLSPAPSGEAACVISCGGVELCAVNMRELCAVNTQ